MDIYTFLSISREEQQMTIRNSHLLSERPEANYSVKLYAVADFYAEVFLTPADEVIKVKAFKSRRLLLPYLDHLVINLEEFECLHTVK